MADDMEDTPPSLPASQPPSMESRYNGRKRSASQKFLMLQAQLSSSNTMYSGGAPKKPSKKPVPPPVQPKPSVKLKRDVTKEDGADNKSTPKKSSQDKKLVHRTLERPKRQGIRTPSKSSLSSTMVASTDDSSPTNAPPDFDQPPPLPSSAPPPSFGDAPELPLPSDVVSFSPTNDDVFLADLSASPDLDEAFDELPPPLPINEPPVSELNGLLPPLNKSSPTEILPNDKPPPASESPPISKHLSHTAQSTHDNFTEHPPLSNSPMSTTIPSSSASVDKPCTNKKETSPLCDPPESPPYDALPPPPPPPLSYPPKEHDQRQLDNDKNNSNEFHMSNHEVKHKEKEKVALADSFGSSSSPYVTSSSSGFSSIRQQEKISSPDPLMTSLHSVWSSSLHSSSLRSSPSLDHHNGSFDDKSDYSLNSSNASLIKFSSTNTNTAASATDHKPSSNVSKFRERIARLKQKREGLMPSPAMSVQSELPALNSRVTSPLQSSYSATLLDSSDVAFSKPHTDYASNISPPYISSEELLTPLQSSPVSHPTTNFLHFASNPPNVSSDVKRVEPFTVTKIRSNRISNTSITPQQSPPVPYAGDSTGVKIVDSHSESAFSKPWSSNITDNATVLSGLPPDAPSSSVDVNHSNNESDGGLTPPPLPFSLPPDAFESNGIVDQVDIISDDATPPDLPIAPPPNIPATTDDEILGYGVPPLPTSPIPFEPLALTEQPFIEPPSIEPPKNFSQTPPEIGDTHISAPTEFAATEIVHDKAKPVQNHTTPEVFKQVSPKPIRPFSNYNTREVESLSQTPASTGSSRHSIHLQYDIEHENNKSSNLPIFVCQHLVTQHQDDESSDSRTQKSSKKSSKLKFPWQKRLGYDRSQSMSDERLKRKGRKTSKEEIRHSSVDIKQDVTNSSMMPRDRNINRLKVANDPVTSASVGDLRRPLAAKQNIDSFSASHSELSKGNLTPPLLAVTTSPLQSTAKKPPSEAPDAATSSNQQQSLKIADKIGESTVSLPHMTTPELYKKLSQPSDPSLFESIMKDIPLFNTDRSSLTEKIVEQPLVEDQSKEKSDQSKKKSDQQEEVPTVPETLPNQKDTTDGETDQPAVLSSQECLNSSHSDSPHNMMMDSFGSPPSPIGSVRSDQGWSSSAANTPNFHDRRWKESALGSINTLTSNDSIRDLLKHRVTIGDWNVDHVIQWLESVGLSSVVPVFRQLSIDGAKLKSLNDNKLAEIGIHSPMLRERILQETWELLTANNETIGRKPRKTSSLLQGMSMVRKDLELKLKDRISEDLTLLQSMSQQQEQMLDSRLSAVREQQEQARELVEGGLAAFMASNGPRDGRQRRSTKIKSLIALADPEDWSVDQVCEWLDQIGLGYYTTTFREHQIDGSALCSLDMQMFAEIGVDSEEDREMILAKVYELFSQDTEAYDDYDDIEALLKKHSGEELDKIKAAISALKSPLLADDVELESSPAPFYFGYNAAGNEALSRSVPMLADTQYDDDDSIPGTPDPRHMRQGSIPLSKAYARRYGRPSYINSLEHQFPGLRRASGRFSSVEDSPPPPLPVKRTSVALDDMAVSSTFPFVHPRQASSPITTSTPTGSPSSLVTADEAAREQPVDVPEPVTVNMEYTTKLAGKLAEKRKGTKPRAVQPAAAASSNSKQAADKMKELASHLSHGELKLQGGASGVKIDGESNQPVKQKKRSRGGFGKKINTVKIKAGGMQSGLVRLYMVDIPHFAHVIYQAYLISSTTTSHELIEQVLKRADIVDDPYRYYVYENCMDENSNEEGVVLSRDECPLQLQIEWPNFYGKRFELRWRSSHVVNVRVQIRGLPNTIRPMQITSVTPCSTLIAVAAHAFQLPDWCKELKMVAVHTKNRMEKELDDTDIPMKFITMQNAKWIVFSLREAVELEESAEATLQHQQQHQQQQQQQSATTANTPDINNVQSSEEDTSPRQDIGSSSKITELQNMCAELENEKEELERQLDDLQRRYNAVSKESNNEAIVMLEKENNRLSGELSARISKSASDAHTITELSDTIHRLESLLKEKDKHMESMNTLNADLQQGSNKMKEQIVAYESQQKVDSETLQDLKDTVEQLGGDVQNKQQEVIELKHDNTRLQKSQHEKEEQLKKSSLASSKDDHTIASLKASLSRQEKDASFLKKEHQRQTLQLKAAEDQINSMRKVLKQKDEVITQLSDVEPWKSANPRSSLHTMLGAQTIGTLISVRAEPQEKGLGIKLSSTEGAGCIVMEVADHSPLVSIIQQGDRLLEINGEDISNSTTKQVVSLLKNLRESMQFVLLRPGPYSALDDTDATNEGMVKRLEDLKATLTKQVEKQMSETKYWRNQYEQIRDASSANASLQQEKDSDIAYYKSTIEVLNEQLSESKRTQEQLQTMLEELHQKHDQHAKEATISVDQALREHTEQMEMMETNHKKQIQALQEAIKEKDQKIQLFRQHLVLSQPLNSSSLQASVKLVDKLKTASQSEILDALKESEAERARHQAYLDQLLLLVIERCPELLNTMSANPDGTRNKAEKWC